MATVVGSYSFVKYSAIVRKARKNKKNIYAGTDDQKEETLRLVGIKVDAIINKKPGFLLDVLRELKMR